MPDTPDVPPPDVLALAVAELMAAGETEAAEELRKDPAKFYAGLSPAVSQSPSAEEKR